MIVPFQLNRFLSNSLTKYTSTDSKIKGKVIPLQAWIGHESSRKLRFPDFKTIGT
jgi:hypothetical protein